MRQEQSSMMHDLMKELETKKDRELRARIEREEINKALKDIERTKTSALERDKRRELERIAAERESLRLKEEEVLDEITSLEGKMFEQERRLREEKDLKQNQVDNSKYYQEVSRKKEIDFARERGEHLA